LHVIGRCRSGCADFCLDELTEERLQRQVPVITVPSARGTKCRRCVRYTCAIKRSTGAEHGILDRGAEKRAEYTRETMFRNIVSRVISALSLVSIITQTRNNVDANATARMFLSARRSTRYNAMATWLAGCLAVTRRYCIKTAKPILKLFRPAGSSIILVSSDPCADAQFQGEPLQRGR